MNQNQSNCYSIIITNYDKDSGVDYEKKFNAQTSLQQVLNEFQLEDAFVISDKKIIQPETKLSKFKSNSQNQVQFYKQINNNKVQNENVRIKYYTKEQPNNYQTKWEIFLASNTPINTFSYQKQLHCIIHKNKKIQSFDIRYKDLQNNNKNEVLEFSVLNKHFKEDEILVIILSDQIKNELGIYDTIQKINNEDGINYQNQIFAIQEQILYYEVEKRSTTIQSILDKLNNQKYIAFQSVKGILDPKKTLNYYFNGDLQCKLLTIENIYQPLEVDQEKIIVNIIQNGQLLMRKQFEESTTIHQIEQNLVTTKKIKDLGMIDFYFSDNLINYSDSLEELIVVNQKEINLEIFDKYTSLDEMEIFLQNALNKVKEAKKKLQQSNEGSVNLIYKKNIQQERSVYRICKMIENQQYNNNHEDLLLVDRAFEESIEIQN